MSDIPRENADKIGTHNFELIVTFERRGLPTREYDWTVCYDYPNDVEWCVRGYGATYPAALSNCFMGICSNRLEKRTK
jgi:hypothetical protein